MDVHCFNAVCWRLSFLHWSAFMPLLKIGFWCMCGSVFGLSVVVHWLVLNLNNYLWLLVTKPDSLDLDREHLSKDTACKFHQRKRSCCALGSRIIIIWTFLPCGCSRRVRLPLFLSNRASVLLHSGLVRTKEMGELQALRPHIQVPPNLATFQWRDRGQAA